MELRRIGTLAVAIVIAIGVAATPLAAQRFEAGFGAGPALPLHEFRTGAKLGFDGRLTLKFQPSAVPVAIRLDAMHATFNGRSAPTFVYPRTRLTALAVSAEYDFDGGEESRWRGWTFGGVGGYYALADRGSPQIPPFGRTYFGLQFGVAGAYRMGLLNPFVELQYVTVFRSRAVVKTLPLLIGFRLGRRSLDQGP